MWKREVSDAFRRVLILSVARFVLGSGIVRWLKCCAVKIGRVRTKLFRRGGGASRCDVEAEPHDVPCNERQQPE